MSGKNVVVIGGAGYVGAVLVPELLNAGHMVTVFDLFIYGEEVFNAVKDHPKLVLIKGDVRDPPALEDALRGRDTVIHLACISNDPSFELDPTLGRSINLDSFRPTVLAAKKAGISRFIYASSSSVYGVKEGVEVTEDLALEPLTDYSRFKAECERILTDEREPGFTTMVLRPATVCGYSPRQRLDVVVNIMTNFAVNKGQIKVMGGKQLRPNIHIDDMVAAYLYVLELPAEAIDGRVYNVADENYSVSELANIVRDVVGPQVGITFEPTNDPRSYHVSGKWFERDLGFRCRNSIEGAVSDLVGAFNAGNLPNSFGDSKYFNIMRMQELKLT
ncbi:MAG: NAD-dependent epimerase/dehydratase family protein [Stellaceae bacterium]